MALSEQAKSFVENKFSAYAGKLDSLSSIPGFDSELERGYEVFKEGMALRQGNFVSGGLSIMNNTLSGASSDPIAFVKSAMRDSVYNGKTDLLKSEMQYLAQNNVPVDDIKSIATGYAKQKAEGDAAWAAAQQSSGGFVGNLLSGNVGAAFAALDPTQGDVRRAVDDIGKALSTDDAKRALGIAAAYFLPGVGAQLGQQLVAQGLITGAAIPYATAIGTALAQTGVGVAQGQPLDTALTNATVNAVTSTGSQNVAKYISTLGASPAVANAITSVGASGLATAAKGGSAADIEKNMTGALAGSTVTGLTGDKLSGAVVGGAITGGAVGAATGAAGALASGGDKDKQPTPGADPGINVAGGDDASALELARISAMPEMLGREGEKSSAITSTTDNEGITIYRRSVTGVTPDGKPYGYVISYDPGAPQGKQFSYETGYVTGPNGDLVDPTGGAGVTSSKSRPTFTPTDETTPGGGKNVVIFSDVGGAGGKPGTPSDKKIMDLTGIGTGNVSGNVSVSPGPSAGAGNVGGNVVIPGSGAGGDADSGGAGGAGSGGGAGTGTGGAGSGSGTGSGTGAGTGTGTGTGAGGTGADDDEKEPSSKEKTYTPELFIYGGTSPKTRVRQTTNLGTTLQAPFYPSSTLGQALTGYRGAGEIEGKKSGKPRRDVWNEESLRLKDALGL